MSLIALRTSTYADFYRYLVGGANACLRGLLANFALVVKEAKASSVSLVILSPCFPLIEILGG